ncbi:hypothetical protein QFZ80_006159 [Paenibacillus sp. V4I7]|nr:hypothetical protein [Paenibacillus sp. V4I7]MDQ0919175.1 hypothetical protein [Paenibacillus sp. V4I5]
MVPVLSMPEGSQLFEEFDSQWRRYIEASVPNFRTDEEMHEWYYKQLWEIHSFFIAYKLKSFAIMSKINLLINAINLSRWEVLFI